MEDLEAFVAHVRVVLPMHQSRRNISKGNARSPLDSTQHFLEETHIASTGLSLDSHVIPMTPQFAALEDPISFSQSTVQAPLPDISPTLETVHKSEIKQKRSDVNLELSLEDFLQLNDQEALEWMDDLLRSEKFLEIVESRE